jgi:methyl-accepting chemotaxis protein
MNSNTIALVRQSWAQVVPIAPQAVALFYQNLFAADPALRPLFKGNMVEQGHKLTQMLGVAVSKLDDLETLVPVLQDLARRHVGYGVQASHYQTVGAALLKTLAQGLGDEFTPPVREAWVAVYDVVADVMVNASEN